jgi:hypothetical protein
MPRPASRLLSRLLRLLFECQPIVSAAPNCPAVHPPGSWPGIFMTLSPELPPTARLGLGEPRAPLSVDSQ